MRGAIPNERGNAIVEFIGAVAGLLIPALLLIVAVVRVQAASFAAESAAVEVARTVTLARDYEVARAGAGTIATLAFADQSLGAPAVQIVCGQGTCTNPGELVSVTISHAVPLLSVAGLELGTFPISASATSYLGAYVDRTR